MYKGELEILEKLSKIKKAEIGQLTLETGINGDSIRRAVESLKKSGYVNTKVDEEIKLIASQELITYMDSTFPEIAVFKKALAGSGINDLTQTEKTIGIRWARQKGFVAIENGMLVPLKNIDEVREKMEEIISAASQINENGSCTNQEALEEIATRKLIEKKISRHMIVEYTGKTFDRNTESGFDVSVETVNAPAGRKHPITKLSGKIKNIMSELGFVEMEGNLVESSFWNFDALFQPQDHPARELADTFYINGKTSLPEDKLMVERIKKSHEEGWKYKWDPQEATKRVLRTHTTALSARYVADIKDKKPRKYFAIGKVFRNEATDYKHLAEFHQVEGIIAWENAKFTDLLGILKEFYSKLGFEKIRFRPSFFPYTEPSLEIEVYFEPRKQWLELGGAGIFRPEVSIPLTGIYPVLAWGLSLERPLMLTLGLEDIRTFYRNDVDFLKSARLDL